MSRDVCYLNIYANEHMGKAKDVLNVRSMNT